MELNPWDEIEPKLSEQSCIQSSNSVAGDILNRSVLSCWWCPAEELPASLVPKLLRLRRRITDACSSNGRGSATEALAGAPLPTLQAVFFIADSGFFFALSGENNRRPAAGPSSELSCRLSARADSKARESLPGPFLAVMAPLVALADQLLEPWPKFCRNSSRADFQLPEAHL